ncbi:aldo/keto reductase [Glutamicibacter sp. Je.9.36]|uniref:aldo/keto reductase n=1 Tax=Glutamicibacter sp. Je.9.36 TaxID=3142837 RepID=UPI003DAA3263
MRESLRRLGFEDPNKGLKLGFGTAGIGNLYRERTDEQSLQVLQEAFEHGARYFDTAPHYGLGLSERRIGSWLRASGVREDLVISTKVGRLLVPQDNPHGVLDNEGYAVAADAVRKWDPSESGVRRSLEASLERLGTDHIEIAYLHDPDCYDLQEGIEQALPALVKLREEGVVKAIGVGVNSVQAATECVRAADLDLVMLAGRYTLLEQPAAHELLPLCVEREVGVVNVGVYNSGLLASPVVSDQANYNYQQASQGLIQRARDLADLATSYGTNLPTLAVQFAKRHPSIVSLVLGASSAQQVRENARRYSQDVPPVIWNLLAERVDLSAQVCQ